MKFSQTARIRAPIQTVWDYSVDIPRVVRCIPGVEQFSPIDDRSYAGVLRVRVGPIGLRFEGKIHIVELDENNRRAQAQLEASDKRARGAVQGTARVHLVPVTETETTMDIETTLTILGSFGDFGQPVMERKAKQILDEFAQNLSRELAR